MEAIENMASGGSGFAGFTSPAPALTSRKPEGFGPGQLQEFQPRERDSAPPPLRNRRRFDLAESCNSSRAADPVDHFGCCEFGVHAQY